MDYELASGRRVAQPEIELALAMRNSFIDFDGKTILLDSNAIEAMRSVFSDCGSNDGRRPGTFHMASIYAPYVQSSLNALDGIDIEQPQLWRQMAERYNRDARLVPVPLDKLETVLRPYQKEGVYWMRFLESGGLCGILADEMGLGKTLQTLAWLNLERISSEARGKPALIVAPSSLVENWRRECEKFTPWRKCQVMSGASRHGHWDEIEKSDIVITSYALLRRDLEHYAQIEFSAAVLDEAQHIKNRETQNAIAAKQIRARSRLVLTGTPVENGVADLWSIMDFLMPDYLGQYEDFRRNYELPILAGESAAEEAQNRLHKKLRPFLLRRLKRDVAKDLPDKIQKVSFSALSTEQRKIYDALLVVFREKISKLVAAKGFDSCRMEVLAILLRLRQICCHLSLLPREMLGETPPDSPSGKLEQFFDLLDEAIDGGHRMLVFSQFVGMLRVLRKELEARGIRYSYIDGETKNRVEACREFNQDSSISVFLISLKAGGTGLNLTGADMVVHFDPWWNPAVEDQATDRAHRIGQHRVVTSVKLIAENTVEEKVLDLQRRKQSIIQATVGTADTAIMQSLTFEDVQALLA
jgi:SNF2 family DNA or RNA helicase